MLILKSTIILSCITILTDEFGCRITIDEVMLPLPYLTRIWSFAKDRLMRHHGIPKEKFLCYCKEMEWRYNNREKFIRSFCEIDGRLDRVFSVCHIISKEPLMTQTGSGKP